MIGGKTTTEATGPLRKLVDAGRVTHVPGANDNELAALLRGASALVSPSLEEGFGLPPLEALALGTPVVLSDIPVYRELYSDWGQFFQPSDEEALAALLVRAAEGTLPTHDPQAVRNRFSWDQTTAKTEAIYSQAMGCWEEGEHHR